MGSGFCQQQFQYKQSIYFKEDYFNTVDQEIKLRQFAEKNLKTISSRVFVKHALWQNQMLIRFIQALKYWYPGYQLSFSKIYTQAENSRKENLITLILEINFPNLKKINLAGNNIVCIENLSRIWLPFLQILQLGSNFSGNDISNIKSIKKLYCPYLFDIVLYNNKFKESKTILNFQSTKIRFLYLQDVGNEQVNDEDIRWIIKLENNQPFTLDASSHLRIVQKSFQQVLSKKIKKCHLYFYNY